MRPSCAECSRPAAVIDPWPLCRACAIVVFTALVAFAAAGPPAAEAEDDAA